MKLMTLIKNSILLFLIFTPFVSKTQESVFGTYVSNNNGVYSEITLNCDSTFSYKKSGGMFFYEESGKFKEKSEIVILYFLNDTILLNSNKNYLLYSITKNNQEVPITYKQTQSFYETGEVKLTISWCDYSAVDFFHKKCGLWYYYDKNSKLIKVEKYKKDKLIRAKKH